jgi:hypothetical protein
MDGATDIRKMLLDGQSCRTSPVTARLPFPYHWVPGEVRQRLARLLDRRTVQHIRRDVARRPATYADNATDVLVASRYSAAAQQPVWSWPSGKRCALVLSHDVDTAGQAQGIGRLRQVAAVRNLPSTFSFVGNCLESYRREIGGLRAGGCAIALHDVKHDNKIAFLSEEQIVERLSPAADALREFGIRGFRSPSWYTSPGLWCALERLGLSHDMSVLDSWPFFETSRNYGVASFYPFLVNNLAVLPNTIPFEQLLRFGYHIEDALSFWQPKIDFIARTGGLIMFNAHPDRWFSGNAAGVAALSKCVDYICESHDPVCLTADQVAEHARSERERGAMVKLGDNPRLESPRHSAGLLEPQPPVRGQNPCLVSRRIFLSNDANAGSTVHG